MINIKLKNRKGIALVEVLAALAISTVVITSLVSLSLTALRSSLQSKLLLEGTKIANTQLERVRAYRDGSDTWLEFIDAVDGCSSSCYMPDATSVNSGSGISGTGLEAVTYYFTATNLAGGALTDSDTVVRVKVTVTWKIGSNTKSTHLYTDLTNWRD